MSALEDALVFQLQALGAPEPVREYRFDKVRRWRFDLAWPDRMLAVEVQGGVWSRGKHGRGSGVAKDYEKLNTAQIMGWKVLQFETSSVKSGEAAELIMKVIIEAISTIKSGSAAQEIVRTLETERETK